jgi:uncharacterized repeat protein (TIGR01451 family)
MTQESEKGHRSWWWALPAAAGVALVMTAILLWSPGPGAYATPEETATAEVNATATAQANATATAAAAPTATRTPAPTATTNPNCELNVNKSDSPTTVGEGGQITYTIKIKNEGTGSGDCADLTVTDAIPTDTDCVSATDDGSLDFDIEGCDASGDVVWDTNDNLDTDDEVVLTMVVELTSGAQEDDTINNEACAVSSNDVGGDCDAETTRVGAAATATPTTAPTATARPTVQPPVVPPPIAPPPVAPPPASLIAPMTGSGADGDSGTSQTLALALCIAGAGLLLVSGVTFAKRTR